jgi:hypothetical protein
VLSSSLEKAVEKFDKLSEKRLSEIARKMMMGAAHVERKTKARRLQKA